jgi:hypothetical protein
MCYNTAVQRAAPQQLELEVTPSEPREAPRKQRSAAAIARTRTRAAALLELPDALLTRSDLRSLGLERRAVDAVFRALPVVALPGYSRPLIRAHDYVELIAQHTYGADRVRPSPSTRGARIA